MNLQPPTAFDTWTGVASAVLYLVVGIGALANAPKDSGARTFFTIAVASLAPYLLPAFMGRIIDARPWLDTVVIATAVSLAVGSVALFHFAQVFPSRRPWIQSRGTWLVAGYVVLPLAAIVGALALLPFIDVMLISTGSGGLGAVGSDDALLLLFVLIPTVFVVGIVLPFAALLSIYKSWQEAKADGRDGARVATLAILVSQLAGGVLTILVVPLLHLVAPAGPWVAAAASLLFGFGLLFPIAYAVGVWRYKLVSGRRI